MNHDWQQTLRGDFKCSVCGGHALVPNSKECTSQGISDAHGPGTELHKLFAALGVKPTSSCNCNAIAAEMDRLGPDGCQRERASIMARITANYDALSWWDRLKIVGSAATHAAVATFWINPLDPIGSLVDEAVKRATLAATQPGQ